MRMKNVNANGWKALLGTLHQWPYLCGAVEARPLFGSDRTFLDPPAPVGFARWFGTRGTNFLVTVLISLDSAKY